MGERDAGNKPKVGDRLPFIYIEIDEKKMSAGGYKVLQGDKIEHPSYIKEKGLIPDYEFYITNQIMKPVSQIFALSLENLKGYYDRKDKYDNMFKKLEADGLYIDKIYQKVMKKKMEKTQEILFSDILRIISNRKSGLQTIYSLFNKNNTIQSKTECSINEQEMIICKEDNNITTNQVLIKEQHKDTDKPKTSIKENAKTDTIWKACAKNDIAKQEFKKQATLLAFIKK
jgi:hypothetical protein